MDNLIRHFTDYYHRTDFRSFQNSFSKEICDTLGTSHSNNHNEVTMVTEMCNTINGKTFDKLRFYSKKIHGTRSYVEFNNRDKPVTTELGDMVIISVATKNKEIIYEKTAIVQNKKSDGSDNWNIDEDKLYLLHNFPTFKGQKGIFKKNFENEVIFLNHSQTLGNYGLFMSPGEMILLNALTVFKLQQANKINFGDIRRFSSSKILDIGVAFPYFDHPFWEEMLYRYIKHFPKYGFPFLKLPFLNNSAVSFNIYEFIRNWTLFNIGEVVSTFGNTVDKDLSQFNRLLLKQMGLTNVINLTEEGQDSFENNLTIIVAHLTLDEK